MFYGPLGMMKTTYTPAGGGVDDTRYYHYDYKQTLRLMSTESGSPIGGRAYYTPYGERLTAQSSPTSRYYQDSESDASSFIHMGARYYDPELGRFISPDPLEASPSTYGFALACRSWLS
jgi:RHS repeat-associated protein